MPLSFSIDENRETYDALLEGMKAFNLAAIGVGGGQKFNVALRDDSGHIVGGVAATLSADSLYLDIVWAAGSFRGQGHGRAMMETIETEARKRGARDAWLYTMSWQARPFYEKLGYVCVGETPFMGEHYRRYFMWKQL